MMAPSDRHTRVLDGDILLGVSLCWCLALALLGCGSEPAGTITIQTGGGSDTTAASDGSRVGDTGGGDDATASEDAAADAMPADAIKHPLDVADALEVSEIADAAADSDVVGTCLKPLDCAPGMHCVG